MAKNKNPLNAYLKKYYKLQTEILVCYRPTENNWWGDRCFFLETGKYEPTKPYNHRMILNNECVIEFDEESRAVNKKMIEIVISRLKKDKIRYMLWDTTNKSFHLHFLFDPRQARHADTLKKTIMRYYCSDLPHKPDYRLSKPHMVRAEFGVHEKTGKCKKLLKSSPKYFELNPLPLAVWNEYSKAVTAVTKRRISADLTGTDPKIKFLLDTTSFKNVGDGHERALFVLLQTLKHTMEKQELKDRMLDWYHYSGGYKMNKQMIERKVDYHWNHNYNVGKFLDELLEDLEVKQ